MTDITAVRTLIGDTNSVNFTDAQIGLFNTLAQVSGPGTEYFFAAAMALDSLASSAGSSLVDVKIGDYQDSSGAKKVLALQAAAEAYRKMYYETPAWAIVETANSDMDALVIIRNFVLRTNP